jgi:hypothetical protein
LDQIFVFHISYPTLSDYLAETVRDSKPEDKSRMSRLKA